MKTSCAIFRYRVPFNLRTSSIEGESDSLRFVTLASGHRSCRKTVRPAFFTNGESEVSGSWTVFCSPELDIESPGASLIERQTAMHVDFYPVRIRYVFGAGLLGCQ